MKEAANPLGVLVGVDGSPESEVAVRWATQEAALHDQPLTLVHAIAPINVGWPAAYLDTSYTESLEANARDVLEQAQKTVEACSGDKQPPTVRAKVAHSEAASTLVTASHDAYMTVVGSRGLGTLGRAILGSVSSGLVNHGHGPIAVIHADEGRLPDPSLPILLGIDGSPASEDATTLAFDEASRRGLALVALHAWSDVGVFPMTEKEWQQYADEGHQVLAERLAGWQEQYPDVEVQRRIVCDQPARQLLDAAQRAQLVVVGSRGRGGFAGKLLGSVASKVVQAAKVPVIVVRPR